MLVLFACGTAAVTGCSAEANAAYILTALAFGLVIVAMDYSIGNISGCHINPAVSLAMLIIGKLNFKDFIGYIIAQFAGTTADAAVLKTLIGSSMGLGANGLYVNALTTILIEAILTFVFVMAIIGVTSKPEYSKVAGLVIGFSLSLVHIFGIYYTGTSVNPARSFGPAVVLGGTALKNLWPFIIAPLIGGALAALIWKCISVKN